MLRCLVVLRRGVVRRRALRGVAVVVLLGVVLMFCGALRRSVCCCVASCHILLGCGVLRCVMFFCVRGMCGVEFGRVGVLGCVVACVLFGRLRCVASCLFGVAAWRGVV